MPLPTLWIVVLVAVVATVAGLAWWMLRPRRQRQAPLPTEWHLSPRPVFSTDERRVYRQLREALPHHIVLSKLPLVRFCQPTDSQEVRFWYELLGSIHVTFAVCSANGRVLQIKQSVLAACRVRYMRCPVDHLPSIAELQLLVPHTVAPARVPQPAPAPQMSQAREHLSSTVASRRRSREALWQDSSFFQDSFFAPDLRDAPASEMGGLDGPRSRRMPLGDDVAGMVVDTQPGGPVTRP